MSVLGRIWGKAREKQIDGERIVEIHPLVCHLIDLMKKLFGNATNARGWLIFLAGIHDIGKATPVFQSKVPELAEVLSNYGLDTINIEKYHNILSGDIVTQFIKSKFNGSSNDRITDFLVNIKYVIGGHHGIFPKPSQFNELNPEYFGLNKWKEIQNIIIKIIGDFSGLNFNLIDSLIPSSQSTEEERRSLWIFIAGLISVADWIASSENFFHFYPNISSLDEIISIYFSMIRKQAVQALNSIGWGGWKRGSIQRIHSFQEIFPFIKDLRPLQEVIVKNLGKIASPSLVIIEAPMGEGKTEAALYLEHYLEAKEGLQGAYIALPTQATANQMFSRVLKYLSNIKQDLRINLHLLHGSAVINKEYSLLRIRSEQIDDDTQVVADNWFTYRKRGLISPFGVGTVDQILLSVLPLRHFFVRLFGLAGKVIIIDEVHSYDVYMSTILEHLLYWLSLLGSTVILLSATLPSNKRKELISTFFLAEVKEISHNNYPRITICDQKHMNVICFEASLQKKNENSIKICWIDRDQISNQLNRLLTEGGKVAIICNKVRRAQELYLRLSDLMEKRGSIDLLHSRYPFKVRHQKETRIIEKYGIRKEEDPASHILVSTQIIEQSLDLDFDLMISELAPIDLIFQRMGRLHRHLNTQGGNLIKRPKKLMTPQFWIIKPSLDDNSIPKFKYPIYSRYILLKTYLSLIKVTSIAIPEDIETLIEEVYDDKIPSNYITNNRKLWEALLEKEKSAQDNFDSDKSILARYRLIPSPDDEDFFIDLTGYLEENSHDAQASLQSLTRITRPSIKVVPLYEHEEHYYLDEEHSLPISLKDKLTNEQEISILNHSIQLSNYHIYQYFINRKQTLITKWNKSALLRDIHHIILSVEKDTGKYYFETEKHLNYIDCELGVYIKSKEEKK